LQHHHEVLPDLVVDAGRVDIVEIDGAT